jgi:hypothetical protein
MGVPRPTRDKAEGDRHTVTPDADRTGSVSESKTADAQDLVAEALPDTSAPPPHDAPRADIHDLPRNEAFRHGAVGGPTADPRMGETASQDIAPTADDLQLEATLLHQSAGRADIDEFRRAEHRFAPGLAERDEAAPVRGPSADARTGRVVTEGETVADDAADADATDRNAARTDDPDAV